MINQLQSQTRITASIISPTLEIDREPQVIWTTPTAHKQTQSTSFRLAVAANPAPIINGTKKIDRSASTSLIDFPLDLQ
jgi:hypothetical protein